MEIKIPGREQLIINTIIFDYNGTLAQDGIIPSEVKTALYHLAENLNVIVLTADTFHTVERALQDFPGKIVVLNAEDQTHAKQEIVIKNNAETTAAVGNGANDRLMLQAAKLGICVISGEGAWVPTLNCADIAVTNPMSVFGLFDHPGRIKATLRI